MDNRLRPSIVYRMTSPSGKRYIGLTSCSLVERMYAHKASAKSGCKTPLYAAIRKHGLDSFKVEAIFSGSFAECVVAEQQIIADEKTKAPLGYNVSDGGEGSPGVKQSAESIAKRSAANTGKKRSAAFSARMSEVHKGKIVSEETRLKMVAAAKKRVSCPIERQRLIAMGTSHPQEVLNKIRAANIGRKASEQTLAKMRATHIARQSSPEYRARMAESARKSWALRSAKNA